MGDLLTRLRQDFQDDDERYAYVEAFMNASIAAQIKHFRGTLSQQELAERIGTKQSGISRIENANYASWKVDTLRRLARAFNLRLRISFEEFGTLLPEIQDFKGTVLSRRTFNEDPVFNPSVTNTDHYDFQERLNLVAKTANCAVDITRKLPDRAPSHGTMTNFGSTESGTMQIAK